MTIGRTSLIFSSLLVTGISVYASQNSNVAKTVILPQLTGVAAAGARSASHAIGVGLAYSANTAAVLRQAPSAMPDRSLLTGALISPAYGVGVFGPEKAAANETAAAHLSVAPENRSAAFKPTQARSLSAVAVVSRTLTISPASGAVGVAKILPPPPGRSVTGALPPQQSLTGNNKAYIDQISLPPVPAAVDQARGESLVYISQANEFDFSQFEQFGAPQYAKVSETGSGSLSVEYGHDANDRDISAVDGAASKSAAAGSGEQADNKESQGDRSADDGISSD